MDAQLHRVQSPLAAHPQQSWNAIMQLRGIASLSNRLNAASGHVSYARTQIHTWKFLKACVVLQALNAGL